MLRRFHPEPRIDDPAIDGDGNGDAATGEIDIVVAESAPFEDKRNQPIGKK